MTSRTGEPATNSAGRDERRAEEWRGLTVPELVEISLVSGVMWSEGVRQVALNERLSISHARRGASAAQACGPSKPKA
jgi:hypothetical protein